MSIGGFPFNPLQPSEVGRLLRADAGVTPRTISIDFSSEPVRDPARSNAAQLAPVRFDRRNPSPSQNGSLVNRLRAATSAPLDRLWKTNSSALEWPAPLMPYQEDGVRALIERPRMLLADDMGLSKTVQAITSIRIQCHQREIER